MISEHLSNNDYMEFFKNTYLHNNKFCKETKREITYTRDYIKRMLNNNKDLKFNSKTGKTEVIAKDTGFYMCVLNDTKLRLISVSIIDIPYIFIDRIKLFYESELLVVRVFLKNGGYMELHALGCEKEIYEVISQK